MTWRLVIIIAGCAVIGTFMVLAANGITLPGLLAKHRGRRRKTSVSRHLSLGLLQDGIARSGQQEDDDNDEKDCAS